MSGTLQNLDSPLLCGNGIQDHCHLLLRLGRKIALAELAEEVKKGSSKWFKTKGPEYHDFYWQNGYGAFSIGQSGVDDLKRYISQQKEHHRVMTFQQEFRAILAKYRVEFDERYVWD